MWSEAKASSLDSWVNMPVLLEAIELLEQGRLSRSLTLWLVSLLELDTPEPSAPLRREGY